MFDILTTEAAVNVFVGGIVNATSKMCNHKKTQKCVISATWIKYFTEVLFKCDITVENRRYCIYVLADTESRHNILMQNVPGKYDMN